MPVSTVTFRKYISGLSGRRLGAFKASAAQIGISFEEYISLIESGKKCCTICKSWKCRSEFSRDKSRWDGLDAKCGDCRSELNKRGHTIVCAEEMRRFGPAQKPYIDNDKMQARYLVNKQVKNGHRPNPNDLHCALCGHKGDDKRHEYHHHMGYSEMHVYDVLSVCSTCHHGEHM